MRPMADGRYLLRHRTRSLAWRGCWHQQRRRCLTMRSTTRASREGATAHPTDATAKATHPMANTRDRRNRSPSVPPSIGALIVSRYPFITHCSPSTPGPKSRAGREGLAYHAALEELAPEPSTGRNGPAPGAVSATGAYARSHARVRSAPSSGLPRISFRSAETAAGPPSAWHTRRWYRRFLERTRAEGPPMSSAPAGSTAFTSTLRPRASRRDTSSPMPRLPPGHQGDAWWSGWMRAFPASGLRSVWIRLTRSIPCDIPDPGEEVVEERLFGVAAGRVAHRRVPRPAPFERMIPAHRMPLPHSTAAIGGFIDPYQHGHAFGRRVKSYHSSVRRQGEEACARRVGRIREQGVAG